MILELAVPLAVIAIAIGLLFVRQRTRKKRPPTSMEMDLTGGLLTVVLYLFGWRRE